MHPPGKKGDEWGMSSATEPVTRESIVRVLEEIAQLLELKGENPFKIRAYRTGA
ncbi:MAG: helix-hairpin-helix domain-containing protein, partial [Verrucomicrobiota bacterium]